MDALLRQHSSTLVLAGLTLTDTLALAILTAIMGYTDSPAWTICTTVIALVGGFVLGTRRVTATPAVSYPLWGIGLAATSGFFGALYLFAAGYVDSVDAMLAVSGRNANVFLLAVPVAFVCGAAAGHRRAMAQAAQAAAQQPGLPVSVNGIAHIQLSVRDLPRAKAFYRALLVENFGMTVQYDGPGTFYAIGARTGIALTPAGPDFLDEPFNQRRPGLHHLCFRARSRSDVDALYRIFQDRLEALGGRLVHAPEDGPWASGYYSLLFEDPDGIRLEINHVPGRGNLDPSVQLPKISSL